MLLRQAAFHGGPDVAELRVAVGMVPSLLGFPIALETVLKVMEYLGDLRMLTGWWRRASARASTRVLLHTHRRGDSGSPRVWSVIIASNVSTRPGSSITSGVRPAPGRRMRPAGNAVPSSISRIPLAITRRDSPDARQTRLTPP